MSNAQFPSLSLRPYKANDLDTITRIVKESWDFSAYGFSDKSLTVFAESDFLSCLSLSSWSRIALIEGEPVGFLLGRIEKDFPDESWTLAKQTKFKRNLINLKFPHAWRSLKDSKTYERVNTKLLKHLGTEMDAEAVFFAVDKRYRRCEIGKILFESFLATLRERDVKTYYLFTDETCTYSFYEKLGMKQAGSISARFSMRRGLNVQMFIYTGEL